MVWDTMPVGPEQADDWWRHGINSHAGHGYASSSQVTRMHTIQLNSETGDSGPHMYS